MKILEIKALCGPNYWSIARTHLIEIKLDLGLYENRPTNKIGGFSQRLTMLIPTLYTHRCSKGTEGGFIKRMQEGTWLGHVIEHVALELQCLAGMECGFGRTRSAGRTGIYNIVFSYRIENAGIYAAKAAVALVEALARGWDFDIKPVIGTLSKIYYQEKLGPSTEAIVNEAQRRGIPYNRLDNDSLVMLGQGKNQRIIRATVADSTSSVAVELVQNKHAAKQMLAGSHVPVPEGKCVQNEEELSEALNSLGFPVVLKPLDGNHGRGVTTNITTKEEAVNALILAKQVSEEVIVEKFIDGKDYRLLVINYKLIAAAKRTPARVSGDGFSTIRDLINKENQRCERGTGHEKALTKIQVDENTKSILLENKLTLDHVLPAGKVLYLKDTANISSGGTAEDVTQVVHPYNAFLAERTARLMNLDICGIDLIAKDISIPITPGNGAVIEVNAAPGFRMHQFPAQGAPRNVAAPVLDMLYPAGTPSRIPVVAVTGTNGKTTTTRLIAHLAMAAGRSVGFTTTDGIYIGNNLITSGDCSGPRSAATVLREPSVDFAVLECARGGILRSGLGFDRCNISVVTNISEDHLDLNGISNLEMLARVKSVVPESTFDDGYAVLNADDPLVYRMRENLSCNVALFSMDAGNKYILEHCARNGVAAYAEDGWLVLANGVTKTRLADIARTPLTLKGKSDCMIQNTLAAVLAAFLSGFDPDTLRSGLNTFLPSPRLNPGRMNIFYFRGVEVIVDYAHNVGGYLELQKYMRKEMASAKIGIIGGTGDRRDPDIITLGELAAAIFDEIIIRHDKDGRGRTNEEISSLLLKGIFNKHPEKVVRIISDEKEALQFAIESAPRGGLIFLSSDNVRASIDFMEEVVTADAAKSVGYGT